MVNKSKDIKSQANESMVNKSMVNKSMVNKSRVNESMVKVLVLPTPYSLLCPSAAWRTGTIPPRLKTHCRIHRKQAVMIVNGELGHYQLHSSREKQSNHE